MGKVLDTIKAHPYATAIGIAVIGGALVLSRSGSASTTTADGVDSTAYNNAQAAEVAAGTQYQVAQIQANQAALQSNNEAAVANNQVSAGVAVAQLQSTDTLAGIAATQAIQTNADTLSAQTTQAVSLLQAQVAENQTAASVATDQINANAYVNIADAPYQSADYIASLNAQSNSGVLSSQIQQLQSEINTVYGDIPQPGQIIGYANNTAVVAGNASYAAAAHTAASVPWAIYTAPTPIASS